MTRIKRPAAAVGAAVLLALSLSACGGDDAADAPTDASVEEFCDAFDDTAELEEIDDEDYEAQAEAAHEYADKLSEVGTPDDMPEDARAGWEAWTQWLADVSADDVEEASKSEESFMQEEFEDEEKNVEALFGYVGENCE